MNKFIDKILILSISLFFVGDFLAKISNVYLDGWFHRIGGLLKLGFEILLISYLVFNIRKRKILIYPTVLLGCYFLGFLVLRKPLKEIFNSWSTGNLYYLNSFLFIFLFIATTKVVEIKSDTFHKIFKIFKIILYINSVFIIFGVLFQIELFRTYPYSARFGYNGFFAKNGEVTYFYMLLLLKLYYDNIKNKHRNLLEIFLIIFVTVFIGKKVMFLFVGLLALFHFLYLHKKKNTYRLISVLLIALIIFFREFIFNSIINYSSFWAGIYEKHGLLGALTSTRSQLLERAIKHINESWNYLNYFFGGINYRLYKVEFDFVDIFLFFGLIGLITYIYFLKNFFYEKGNKIKNTLLIILLICAAVSGGLFFSVSSMVLFYITFSVIGSVNNEKVSF